MDLAQRRSDSFRHGRHLHRRGQRPARSCSGAFEPGRDQPFHVFDCLACALGIRSPALPGLQDGEWGLQAVGERIEGMAIAGAVRLLRFEEPVHVPRERFQLRGIGTGQSLGLARLDARDVGGDAP